MSKNIEAYSKAYGIWTVTTEGDCEGRTVKHLGAFEGYLDEIAFALADKCAYSLQFKASNSLAHISKAGTKISISLDIDSGTWNMDEKGRAEFFRRMLAGRNVSVKEGQYYASVVLVDGSSPEEILRKENELKKQKALAKLTDEERKLLGLGEIK